MEKNTPVAAPINQKQGFYMIATTAITCLLIFFIEAARRYIKKQYKKRQNSIPSDPNLVNEIKEWIDNSAEKMMWLCFAIYSAYWNFILFGSK